MVNSQLPEDQVVDQQGLNQQVAHYGFYQYEQKGQKVTEILLAFNEDERRFGVAGQADQPIIPSKYQSHCANPHLLAK